MKLRIGFGYDVHPLKESSAFFLGGIKISHHKGSVGHSDADVLIHAICDALLGAAALGDIGKHFPDTNTAYRNISSLKLLKHVGTKIHKSGFTVNNIDSTVLLEKPKIAKYVDVMQQRIGKALNISTQLVSIKATTHEGLGSFGREEGCGAFAIASILQKEKK